MVARALVLVLCSFYFPKASFGAESWKFSFGEDRFDRSSEDAPLLNLRCQELLNSKKACRAEEVLKEASIDQIRNQWAKTSANPGAILCENLKGSVRIGKSSEGNENAFCEFSDGSRTSCGSLLAAAIKKDKEKRSKF